MGSAVSVYLSGNQSITAETVERVEFDTELYDVLSEFNTTTHKFTASEAGKYLLNFHVEFLVHSAEDWLEVYILQNLPGDTPSEEYTEAWIVQSAPATLSHSVTGSKVLDLSADDTLQLWVRNYHNDDALDGGDAMDTFMTITRIQ